MGLSGSRPALQSFLAASPAAAKEKRPRPARRGGVSLWQLIRLSQLRRRRMRSSRAKPLEPNWLLLQFRIFDELIHQSVVRRPQDHWRETEEPAESPVQHTDQPKSKGGNRLVRSDRLRPLARVQRTYTCAILPPTSLRLSPAYILLFDAISYCYCSQGFKALRKRQ